jgi:hypothetical protein
MKSGTAIPINAAMENSGITKTGIGINDDKEMLLLL